MSRPQRIFKTSPIQFAGVSLGSALVLATAAFAVYFLWLINSQSKARAEWEHGITLPPSATAFQCKGDANHLILDRDASTLFEMAESDLPAFRAGLSINPGLQTFVIRGQGYSDFTSPWITTAPVETLSCDSPTGDWLHVQVYAIAPGRVGVWMFTDWN